MEMQSMLTQMIGLVTASSSEGGNIGSQKVEGKSGIAFQDYMSSATKQTVYTASKNQSLDNKTINPSTEQREKTVQTFDDLSATTNEAEKGEISTQEVQIQKGYEEDDNVDGPMEDSFDAQCVVHEWKEEVQEMLCEEFDLSDEELERIMSELGIQFSDLQSLSNIQQFVLAVAGIDDRTALLTNEVLAKQVNFVEETIKQISTVLMQEYDVSNEDLTNYLEQDVQLEKMDSLVAGENMLPLEKDYQQEVTEWNELNPTDKAEEKLESFSGSPEGELEVDNVKSAEETLTQQKNSTDVNVISVEETAMNLDVSETMKSKKTEEPDITTFDVDEEAAEPKIEITVEKTEEDLQEGEEEFSESDKGQDSHSLFEHFVENLSVNKVTNVEQPDMKMNAIAQMREIVTQVVEQIKVRVSVDTTSMEIQLNPANLGKVNLTVVAREGHLTAQFVTENEIARQALESQVQQLRENLGEQGLKIDKVEVSVSNFDFSHSNQANAEEQRQQHSQEQRKVHRDLNLNDVVNLDDLTEEEQLAARIMTDNGNQVDYTA